MLYGSQPQAIEGISNPEPGVRIPSSLALINDVRKAGYSLIEILVSLAIFSLTSLALTSGATTIIRAGNISEHFTQATILAQDKLEALCAQPVLLTSGSDAPLPGFTRAWAVTPDSPTTGVAQIDVTVSWTDYDPHTVTLTTVVND